MLAVNNMFTSTTQILKMLTQSFCNRSRNFLPTGICVKTATTTVHVDNVVLQQSDP